MSAPQKVSFTVRRPTPISRASSSGADSDSSSFRVPALPRHLTNNNDSSVPGSPLARSSATSPQPRHGSDSSGEEDDVQDELVTGFDKFGVQRCVSLIISPQQCPQLTKAPLLLFLRANGPRKPQVQEPLVIPALTNRDWREVARKRKGTTARYLPNGADVRTGADGSVGGLGTKDTINSGPVLSGLQVKKSVVEEVDGDIRMFTSESEEKTEVVEAEENEDQKALRAILAGVNGDEPPELDAIPIAVSEADALKQDVDELPESATLDDYDRVPVAQFGAALLRGMGWKEGQAASRKGKGPVQPYMPESRPALLGIGAKEQEVYDDGRPQNRRNTRPERRYVPVVRKDKDGNEVSEKSSRDRDRERDRRRSRSPERYERRRDRDDDRNRDRYRESGSYRDRERHHERGGEDRSKDRNRRDYR